MRRWRLLFLWCGRQLPDQAEAELGAHAWEVRHAGCINQRRHEPFMPLRPPPDSSKKGMHTEAREEAQGRVERRASVQARPARHADGTLVPCDARDPGHREMAAAATPATHITFFTWSLRSLTEVRVSSPRRDLGRVGYLKTWLRRHGPIPGWTWFFIYFLNSVRPLLTADYSTHPICRVAR